MAGSYSHVTKPNGNYRGCDLLDHMGDASEAIKEMHWMINYLAGGDRQKIFEAHKAYVAAPDGFDNPEYAKTMKFEGWLDE